MKHRSKTPLLRAEEKLNQVVLRLLRLCGIPAKQVFPLVAIEQPFFLIDKSLYRKRPDLVHTGRTLFGAPLAKKDLRKRRHKIVTPWERGGRAVGHHARLMKEKEQRAAKDGLVCLFPEIPGMEKHLNWTLVTNTGFNLLEPLENRLVFLILWVAVWGTAQEHGALFRGDHFSFRCKDDCAFSLTLLNAVVADRLHLILDEIADRVKDRKLSEKALWKKVLSVLSKLLRGPPPSASLLDKKTVAALEDVFTEEELQRLYEEKTKQYVKTRQSEAKWMVTLFESHIVPAVPKELLGEASALSDAIQRRQEQMADLGWEAKAKVFSELVAPQMAALREKVDALEQKVKRWPLPKYEELLR